MAVLQGPVQTTYSFKDLTGVLSNPLLGASYQLVGGNIGNGKIVIRMITDRLEMETGADGTVMPSYIPGQSAEISIEVQQTSSLHHALLALYNQVVTAADGGDLSSVVATTISLRTILDGSGHLLSGVGFKRIPDKAYGAKGENLTWVLMAASAVNQ
jgi:hypothetical protein